VGVASVALVRFFGGGGNPGSIQAVTLENEAREGTRSLEQRGEESYPSALAAPIWGAATRLFRGHPRITGLLMWGCAGAVDSDRRQAWR